MTDRVDARSTSSNIPEKKVTLNTSFSCNSCGSGAEKYSELFNHGTCRNCGAPLEQFSATLTEKGETVIKGSLLLIYSKTEMEKTASEVTSELGKNGVGIIDAHDIIDGSQTSVVSANLSYVMDIAAGVLIIPSEHLENEQAISTCLNDAIFKKVEKNKLLIPLYTVENISSKLPFGLVDTAGINWDGKVDDIRAMDRDRAINDIQELVTKNTSSK
ncbi:MAG: hypothetical protein ABIJ05_02790 [Patescibacteria group bacterium]